MKRLTKVFGTLALGFIGLSLLGYAGSIVWLRLIGPYDRFYRCELVVSSPRSAYVIGDSIELIYEIRSKSRARIRLFKDRSKSLCLFVRSSRGNVPDLEDTDFFQDYSRPADGAEIEVIELDADKPFRMIAKGVITRDEENGGIILEFGEFGRFKKKGVGTFLIGGYWRPIHPEPADSLEDYTNTIVIEISNNLETPRNPGT